VRPASLVRRVALLAMALITAWSFWAWAQPANPALKSHPVLMAPEPQMHGAARAQETGQAAAEPEDESPGPINWTEFGQKTPPFVASLINFAILAAGYYLLGKKPIGLALRNRRDAISKEIDEAQAMKREAEARAKMYQAKLEMLEEEVRSARESLLRVGEAERERIVKEADAKAERMRRDAVFMVEQEMKQIRIDLWREAVDAAVVAAETLLKGRISASDQERLAEDYLADLGKQEAPPAASVSQESAS
jgi:F-type H+-transporting ATPase subunit b